MDNIALSKNCVVKYLGKDPAMFTRADIVDFVENNGIEMINFMYPAEDGRLKTLNFVINNKKYLESILTGGERVDGSSLFSFVEAGNSDLYVIPRYSTAFVDPFAPVPTLAMLCSFFTKEGKPLDASPEHTLRKACEAFQDATGLHFEAMGELEYYVIAPSDGMFPATDQRGYHESMPFAKFNNFRARCMHYIAQTGAQIKYGHSEVGNFTLDNMVYEQNEIEFLPVPACDAADQLMLAKWVIRNLAYAEHLNVTFAPKITTGKAGSGMHVHMRLTRDDGSNALLNAAGTDLSDDAMKLIAGLMELAPAITAFGNTNPTSYFRLVPHQEAPTNVCWGKRNRSVLVRVPLGWTANTDMSAIANPQSAGAGDCVTSQRQTIEIRSADGSAHVQMLMAALAVAARRGFENPDALRVAADTFVDVNIHSPEAAAKVASLAHLPASCEESAAALEAQREAFQAKDIFSEAMVTAQIEKLRRYGDSDLHERIRRDPFVMKDLVQEHFHCG